MHIEKDRKTGNYGNCPKCIHIKYSSYPQVIHIGWITYVNHVYSRCKDVCKRKRGDSVCYREHGDRRSADDPGSRILRKK